METHPDNQGGKFTVTLQEPLHLDYMWEVGLVEAIYHRDWDTAPTGEYIKLEYRTGWPTNYWEDVHDFRRFYLLSINFFDPLTFSWTFIPNMGKPPFNRTRYMTKSHKYSHHALATTFRDLLRGTLSSANDNVLEITVSLDRTENTLTIKASWKNGVRPPGDIRDVILYNLPDSMTKLFGLPDSHFNIVLGGPPTVLSFGSYLNTFPYSKDMTELQPKFETIQIPALLFDDNEGLVDAIKKAINQTTLSTDAGTLSFDIKPNGMAVFSFTPGKLAKKFWKFHISHSLADLLGMTSEESIADDTHQDIVVTHGAWKNLTHPFSEPPIEIPTNVDLEGTDKIIMNRGIDELWIYTDIISRQILGNKLLPLLRIVPVQGEPFGEGTLICYNHPHYVNLSANVIQEINITIQPSYGSHVIKFQQPTILTLHFRRKV